MSWGPSRTSGESSSPPKPQRSVSPLQRSEVAGPCGENSCSGQCNEALGFAFVACDELGTSHWPCSESGCSSKCHCTLSFSKICVSRWLDRSQEAQGDSERFATAAATQGVRCFAPEWQGPETCCFEGRTVDRKSSWTEAPALCPRAGRSGGSCCLDGFHNISLGWSVVKSRQAVQTIVCVY